MTYTCYNCFRIKASDSACPYCGYDHKDADRHYPYALKAGSILNGRYTVGRVLGQGGFGITYIAQDYYQAGQCVAIKEYFPSEFAGREGNTSNVIVHSVDQQENYDYGKEKFLEEAKTLAAFNGDEHIVRIYSYFEENNTAYFTMEYVEGLALDKYMAQQGGRLSCEEADRLILPLMDSLGKIHAKGIVHRDIAPDNIIITKDGTAKLIDFGAARYSTGEKSKSLDVILKHGFAPKEQYLRRGRQGPFTDVYALAATYYYAITGKVPPEAIERIDEDSLIPPSSLGIRIPEKTEDALFKAMEINAADRYQNMGEFYQAMASQAYDAPPPSPPKEELPTMKKQGLNPTEAGGADLVSKPVPPKQKAGSKEKPDVGNREYRTAPPAKNSSGKGKKIGIISAVALCVIIVVVAIGLFPSDSSNVSIPPTPLETFETAETAEIPDSIKEIVASASPDSALGKIVKDGVLTVAVDPDSIPMEFIDRVKSGQERYVGFDISLARYLAEMLGVSLEIQAMDEQDCINAVLSGDVPISISSYERGEFSKNYDDIIESQSYYAGEKLSQPIVVIRADNAEKYKTEADFFASNPSICVTTERLQRIIDNQYSIWSLHVDSETSISFAGPYANPDIPLDIWIEMLEEGSFDAVIAEEYSDVEKYVDSNPNLTFCRWGMKPEYDHGPYTVLIKKGDMSLYHAVNEVLEKALASDLYINWYNSAVKESKHLSAAEIDSY